MAGKLNIGFLDYSFIAIGGALGASFRFFLTIVFQNQRYLYSIGLPSLPISTLLINILGSLTIGVFYFFFTKGILANDSIRFFAVIGFLGAFTTFSTFSLETFVLLEEGNISTAILYIFLSVSVCILSTFVGINTMRILYGP